MASQAAWKHPTFYLGLALLFTHELDAVRNYEWRVLPLIRSLGESVGEFSFIAAHVPIFAIVVAAVASLDVQTRALARDLTSAFLVVHALLHAAFSGHAAYEFDSLLSTGLIYGGGVCGVLYLAARVREGALRGVRGE